MRYAIEIQGVHCPGCSSLITLSLEELGYQDIIVTDGTATFTTDQSPAETTAALDRLFANDLKEYQYTHLQSITS